MLTLPRRLKGLYRYERNGKVVLGNLESGLILQASPLLQEFLTVCENLSTTEVRQYLKAKHPGANVDHFLRRLEVYAPHLFADVPTPVQGRTFSLSQWLAKGPRTFTTMTINLTHACNLRCDYCFEGIDFRQDTQSMPSDVAKKATELFVDQLQGQPGQITITGGEPLLHYETILDIVQVVQRRKAQVSFLLKTNGTLLTPEIRRTLAEAGFVFQLSIDGPEAVHNRHRKDVGRHGTFDRVLKAITGLLEDVPGERVRLHGTVTHETVSSVGESYQFLNSLGVRSVVIKPVMGNVPAMALDLDDQAVYAREVYRQAERAARRGHNPGETDDMQKEGLCGIGLWHIAVDVDGTLYPCYRLSGMEQYRMGHIDQGLIAAVAPAELLALYDWENPESCGACSWRTFCSRGCYSDRLLSSGASACESSERVVGERIISLNFQNDEVVNMLPVL